MNEFDRFEEENQKPTEADRGYSYEREESRQQEAPSAQPTQWYGVTYSNGEPHQTGSTLHAPTAQGERTKKRLVGFVALILCACILMAALAGGAGFLIARSLLSPDADGDSGAPTGPTATPGSTDAPISGNIYEVGNAATYNYAGVSIPKNDGSALVGSTNGSAGAGATTLIAAIAAVRNSVVEITTTATSYRGQLVAGAGSGVIIHADGIIVTNNHVIDGASSIYVRLANGNTYAAYLRGTDEENDIAILKITPQETLTVARLGCSSALALGEDIFVIGNPLGELGGTVTNGIISALEREVEVDAYTMTLIQTNAAINSGNSGGAMFNMAGELVGVVNAKYSATGVEGLGFAIPIDTAILSVNQLLKDGYIKGIPSLGVTISETPVMVGFQFMNLPYVYADNGHAVLKTGDIIYKIGDVQTTSSSTLKRAIRAYKVGDVISVTVYRDKQMQTLNVTLVEYVPTGSSVSFGS